MQLYEEAFPLEERRNVTELAQLIREEERMSFDAIYHDGVLAGLFVHWDFGDFHYLEHLAVYQEMRNHKIGKQVLDLSAKLLSGLRILEVEPAESEMPIRRIHYYERNGYAIYDKKYHQPSYHKDGKGIDLWIMCNETPENLQDKLTRLKTAVYRGA